MQPRPPLQSPAITILPPTTVLLPVAAVGKFFNDKSNPVLFCSETFPWLSITLSPKPTALPAAQRIQSGLAPAASRPSASLQPRYCVSSFLRAFAPAVPCFLELTSCLSSWVSERPLLTFWLLKLPHYVTLALAGMSLSKMGTDGEGAGVRSSRLRFSGPSPMFPWDPRRGGHFRSHLGTGTSWPVPPLVPRDPSGRGQHIPAVGTSPIPARDYN